MNPYVTPYDLFLIGWWMSAFVGMATFNYVWLGGLIQAEEDWRK